MELMTANQPLTMSSMEPINITSSIIGGETIQTVNARELHAFLEVGKDFSNWVKDRIEAYDFIENRDFVVFAEIGGNPRGGRPAKEYALSLDMAKELAMVERNEKGKQARAYFIECERRAKQPPDLYTALNDPNVLRATLGNYVEKVLALESKVESMAGEVKAYELIAKAEGSLSITEAAKSLQMRPQDLFRWLQAHGWIYKRHGGASWLGYQTKTNAGYLEHKVETIQRNDGSDKIVEQVRITPKGIAKLAIEFGVPALKQSA